MKKSMIWVAVIACLLACFSGATAQKLTPVQESALRAKYPQSWELKVAAGTRLDSLRQVYDARLQMIPSKDREDDSPYPLWFRAYLRDMFPDLPDVGPYQYPRVAAQILQWMASHPDLRPAPAADIIGRSMDIEPSRVAIVGTNINISNLDERNSESFIAVDYNSPQYLIAASNNITGSGRQKQFYSSNSGVVWNTTELPLADGSSFHSDPAVAWTTDGSAWAATLGIASGIDVQVFKSLDRGANWRYVATVSTGSSNDKELMWIDTYPASPFTDNIYLAWDVPGGGMRFARSTNMGATWSGVTSLSSDAAIGCHLTSGPAGEVYVAWPDLSSRKLKIRKSTDGGGSFAAVNVIATTNDSYEVSIPAMCSRKVLIYLSIGVDRSDSPRKGWVYAAWTDRNGTAADPGCSGITDESNANIYFSRSEDGGSNWSTPTIVHSNPSKTDQFNQWLDVDPVDGTIHVMYYDTRDDTDRKEANVYYVCSRDGGNTWINETLVTTQPTNETASPADLGNQYGDYNGLAAYQGVAYPVWTDRRAGVPGDKEQIFTAVIGKEDSTQGFQYEYAAKIVCGTQRDPEDMRLVRGFYATAINIHSPNKEKVRVFKKLALTYPPKEEAPGKIYKIAEHTLGYDEAMAVDCMDLQTEVFPNGFPAPYIKGFVIIQSTKPLDVTAVYTTASLDKEGRVESHSSMDVEQIKGRKIGEECKPDLVVRNIDMNTLDIDCPTGPGSCVTKVEVTIANIGECDAGPFNVRINLDPSQSVQVDHAVAGLAASATLTFTVVTEPGGNCFDPDCTICVEVDDGNDVDESDETNNSKCETTIG